MLDRSWCKFAGADHVLHDPQQKMSAVGEEVANILGEWARGIYHLKTNKVNWSHPHYIDFKFDYGGDLSTWDFNGLTRLMLLCHDRAVRLEITPCNPRFIRLTFHPRQSRTGCMAKRHPTAEEALRSHREMYPGSVKVFDENQSVTQ
jgi:hypothetical protein